MKKQAMLGRTSRLSASGYDIVALKDTEYGCAVEAVTETIEKSEFLVVYIYTAKKILNGDTQAVTRTFLDRTNYITQDLESQEPKWLTATLVNLLHAHAPYGKKIYVSDETRDIIAEFFNKQPEEKYPLKPIHAFQEQFLALRMEKKDNAIKEAADRVMNLVQDVPDDFVHWIEESALLKSRYIFYKYTGKVKVQGYCTHCKQEVELRKPKQNVMTECPNCKSHVTLKTESKATKVADKTVVTLLQYITTSQQLILRTFEVSKRYGREYKTPHLTVFEFHRTLNPAKEIEENYSYGCYKWRGHDVRWNKVLDIYTQPTTPYPHNLHELSDLPELKYSGLEELAKSSPDVRFGVNSLIAKNLQGDHIAEKLGKVGLCRLAIDYIDMRERYYCENHLETDGTTLNDILQVEHDDAKLLIEANISMNGLGLFSNFRYRGKRLSLEELLIIEKLHISKHHIVDRGICDYTTVTKALKYLGKVYEETGKNEITNYRDYLNMCNELEMDMKSKKVLFPKKLKESHDIVLGIMNTQKAKAKAEALAKDFAEIQERSAENEAIYGYQNEKYMIRSAKNVLEIVNEGVSLSHCVASESYLTKAAKGEIAILFLRKVDEPETSFYTIEMRDKKIIQCRTKGNKGVERKELRDFLEDWKKELRHSA